MQSTLGQANPIAILFFSLVVLGTMVITYFAAKRTRSTSEFYAAGRSVTGFQNGLALAGDYMSAASFLGISGIVALQGYDGIVYAVGYLVGWPALMFLVAEPLRNLGKYTFADVVASHLKSGPIRIASAIGGILVVLNYTIAQMVGSGKLIELMFGMKYLYAEVIVGTVMLLYVLFGGMLATTWVQIIKAVLLLLGVTVLAILAMAHFDFSFAKLFMSVENLSSLTGTQYHGKELFRPGGLVSSPLDAFSLGLALMFGPLGLPHILMRFFTVPDAKEARKSVVYATSFIGYFYILIPIVGFSAAVILTKNNLFSLMDKGGNMVAPLLSEILGGSPFLGFIAAVAFATILAVVAGLTLAASSAMSHDLYVSVFKKGNATETEQVKVARISTVIFGVTAVAMGILFENMNVAFLVGLAFAIAASANFPALFLSIAWKRFTTYGAVWSIIAGGLSATILIVLSPTVWVNVLGYEQAIFPLKNPALVSMSLSFFVALAVSLALPEKEAQEKFDADKVRTYLGIGAE